MDSFLGKENKFEKDILSCFVLIYEFFPQSFEQKTLSEWLEVLQ